METPEWVKECKSSEGQRPMLHTPITFDWNGTPWTAATNGHKLGAVRGACSDAKALADLGVGAPNIVSVLVRPTSAMPRYSVSVAELRTWFQSDKIDPNCKVCHGKGQGSCDNCDGSGYVPCECRCGDSHERECEDCKGKGSWVCSQCLPSTKDVDLGKMFGHVFNRSILRPVLAKLPYEKCYFQPDGERAAWFYDDSHTWLLLFMPMRPDPFRDKNIPVFTPSERAAA